MVWEKVFFVLGKATIFPGIIKDVKQLTKLKFLKIK